MAAKQPSGAGTRLRRWLAPTGLGLLLGAALPLLLPTLPEGTAERAARTLAWVPGLEEVRAEPLELHARWGAPALALDEAGRLRTELALHAVLAAWGLACGVLAAVLWLVPSLRVPLAAGGLLGALLGFALASSFRLDGGDWVRAGQSSLLRGLQGLPGVAEVPVPPADRGERAAAENGPQAGSVPDGEERAKPVAEAGAPRPEAAMASPAAEPDPAPAEPVEPTTAEDADAKPAASSAAEPAPASPAGTPETIAWRLASRRGTVAEAATPPPWTGTQPPPRLTARGGAWFVLYGALALVAAAFLFDAAGFRRWRHRLPRAALGGALLAWMLIAFLPAPLVRRLEAASASIPFTTLSPVADGAAVGPAPPAEGRDGSPAAAGAAEPHASGSPSRALELAGFRLLEFRPAGAASVSPALLAVLVLLVLVALTPVALLASGWSAVRSARKRGRSWLAERRQRKRLRELENETPSDDEREERRRQQMRDDLKEWLDGGGEQPPEGG